MPFQYVDVEDAISRDGLRMVVVGNVPSPWGEAATAWTRAVDQWSPAQLDRALAALLAADCALKESKVSSDEQVLATVVLELCAA